jgi:hypothetical protein
MNIEKCRIDTPGLADTLLQYELLQKLEPKRYGIFDTSTFRAEKYK